MTRMTRPDCAVMCNLINTERERERERERQTDRQTDKQRHTHTPQYEWHRMTRTAAPDCAVVCNLINTHRHTDTQTRTDKQVSLIPPWEDQCEWHRMTRMTRPDCAVMCNLINTHTHTHSSSKNCTSRESVSPLSRLIRGFVTSIIDPTSGDQCEWHRMTRRTEPDCAVMCNLINTHTRINTHTHTPLGRINASGIE